jgi:tripartite-type tricarboxylate transporter receptor subunit TctC
MKDSQQARLRNSRHEMQVMQRRIRLHLQRLKHPQPALQTLDDLRHYTLQHSAFRNVAFHSAECASIMLVLDARRVAGWPHIRRAFEAERLQHYGRTSMQQSLRKMSRCLGFIIALAPGLSAHAEAVFPNGTIRFVAPNSASTPPDIISRIIAKQLTEDEHWRVIVENRPGGITTIAANDVLTQPADGHSLFGMSVPSVAAPALVQGISYGFERDFEPVIKASVSYNVLVVNPSVPATSVAELVALLKSQPDKLTFSSGGFGTPAHLIGEQFKLQTGTRAQHVPYAQFPQAIGDLLNGTNSFMFVTMLPVVDLIKTGKLRALAVTGPKRVSALPDVPTIVEAGFPSLVVEDWVGFAVRRGAPKETIAQLNGAINRALQKTSVREAFAKLGAEPAGGSPEEFGELVKSQVQHWKKVVADAGIRVQQ